ncbi:hypothetical protein TWF694_001726 [Orbilia ellipsospora]|uniref:Uncharacterized protein n=1 Tax=Orbilia ellipsospora TaxID=2528407 RepID=A0AAV9X4V3_9PEZI
MSSIELQIGHAKTPIPFLIPLVKAKDPKKLRALILQRTGCSDETKVTMYNRALKVIHMDDWEDMIEPGHYYMADINDAWLKQMLCKPAGGDNELPGKPTNEQPARGSSSNPVDSSVQVSSSDPVGSSDAACSSSRVKFSSDRAGASGLITKSSKTAQKRKVTSSGLSNASKSTIDTVSDGEIDPATAERHEHDKKLLRESTHAPSSAKGKHDFDSDPEVEDLGAKLTALKARVGPEYESFYEDEAQKHIPPRPRAANKRIPPPLNFADTRGTPKTRLTERPVSGQDTGNSNSIQFVRSQESYTDIQDNLLKGNYNKNPFAKPFNRDGAQAASAKSKDVLGEKVEYLTCDTEDTQISVTENSITHPSHQKKKLEIRLVKPSQRYKTLKLEPEGAKPKSLIIKVPMTATPLRIINRLRKNPTYTRLIVLEVSDNDSGLAACAVITPGSRMVGTTVQELGWVNGIYMTWEHIENANEQENISSEPWDEKDPGDD